MSADPCFVEAAQPETPGENHDERYANDIHSLLCNLLGTAANAWPKRKPFQSAFLDDPVVRKRVLLSFFMLNVIPVVFFAIALFLLGGKQELGIIQILTGVVPAFAVFGLYRVWLGIIELNPERYYYKKLPKHLEPEDPKSKSPEPTKGEVHPTERPRANIAAGVAYIVGSIILTLILRLLW